MVPQRVRETRQALAQVVEDAAFRADRARRIARVAGDQRFEVAQHGLDHGAPPERRYFAPRFTSAHSPVLIP
jgi:hypothetical protein